MLTWEWQHGLRSFVHPLLFALPLALLSALGLDSPQAVVGKRRACTRHV